MARQSLRPKRRPPVTRRAWAIVTERGCFLRWGADRTLDVIVVTSKNAAMEQREYPLDRVVRVEVRELQSEAP